MIRFTVAITLGLAVLVISGVEGAPLQCDLDGFLPSAPATTTGCCAFNAGEAFYINATFNIVDQNTNPGSKPTTRTTSSRTELYMQSPDAKSSKLWRIFTDYSTPGGFQHIMRTTKLFRPDLGQVFVMVEQSGVRTLCFKSTDNTDLAKLYGCFGPAKQPAEFFSWQKGISSSAVQYQAPGNDTDAECSKMLTRVHDVPSSAGVCTPLSSTIVAKQTSPEGGTHSMQTTATYNIVRNPTLLPSIFTVPMACQQENLLEADPAIESRLRQQMGLMAPRYYP